MLLPDSQVELQESSSIRRPLARLAGELAQGINIWIAEAQARIRRMPDRFVLPITVGGRLENDRQERWIIDLTACDFFCVPMNWIIRRIAAAARSCSDDQQRGRHLGEASADCVPQSIAFMRPKFVDKRKARRATKLRRRVGADR